MSYFKQLVKSMGRPYFIAELGINHNGDVALAKRMIAAAKAAGADAVKIQSFSASSVSCRQTLSVPHVDKALGVDGDIYTLLDRLSLSYSQQTELKQYADAIGVTLISTPFSFEDVDFLTMLGVPFLKIGSTDTANHPFLAYVAKTRLPLILSTGMSSMAEVKDSVAAIRDASAEPDLALLHCVSLYPPEPGEVNLRSVQAMAHQFPEWVTGYSDHTLGTWAGTGAIALGACIIEKHFTLDKISAGPDQAVSADPAEFAKMVQEGTHLFNALGLENKQPGQRELTMRAAFRRSLVSKIDIPKGAVITKDMLTMKRPGSGLDPNQLPHVIGQVTLEAIPADIPLEPHMITVRSMVASKT